MQCASVCEEYYAFSTFTDSATHFYEAQVAQQRGMLVTPGGTFSGVASCWKLNFEKVA